MKIDKSKNKLSNYLEDFIDSEYFQIGTKSFRKKYGIPLKGFKFPKDLKTRLTDLNYRSFYTLRRELEEEKWKMNDDAWHDMYDLFEKFPVQGVAVRIFLKIYLLYDFKLYEVLKSNYSINDFNFCEVGDIESIKKAIPVQNNALEDLISLEFGDFPVILKINPAIGQRVLVNYIESHWKLINYYLQKYKNKDSKLGKTRTRNKLKRERDRFIYKNRDLPYKDIVVLVSDKFPTVSKTIDEGSVGKIISLERKRRKQV